MDLLYLNNYHYMRGGSERVYFGEMSMMESHGHAVHAFSREHPENFPNDTAPFFPAHIATEQVNLSWGGIKTLKEIIYSQTAKGALSRMLDTFHPDIAHAHNIYGRLTTSVLDLLHEADVPILLTLHDYKLICPNYKLMHHRKVCEDCKPSRYHMAVINRCHKGSYAASAAYAMESFFNQWLSKYKKNVRYFISPSSFLRDKLIEFGWPSERIALIPNFIDTSEFIPRFSPGNYFLYLGRLSHEKGIQTLLSAFLDLTKKGLKLIIVGEGPIRNDLELMAEGSDRVVFKGYLSGESLKEAIRGARAVVVPSEWYENAPLSVLEAMAYGKPVLGALIGGIPEMVQDGVTGALFRPGDAEHLREKLKLMQDCPESEITRMGMASRKRIEDEFTAERHYERLHSLYHKAIQGN